MANCVRHDRSNQSLAPVIGISPRVVDEDSAIWHVDRGAQMRCTAVVIRSSDRSIGKPDERDGPIPVECGQHGVPAIFKCLSVSDLLGDSLGLNQLTQFFRLNAAYLVPVRSLLVLELTGRQMHQLGDIYDAKPTGPAIEKVKRMQK